MQVQPQRGPDEFRPERRSALDGVYAGMDGGEVQHVLGRSGETLAWIQWQVAEAVVCWCGNEISGQWGCIPTRIAPGAAYRDPAVAAEAVAKKVRRSAA